MNNILPAGLLIIICAPSGTGKSTLISLLRKDFPQFQFSISYTTRTPRPGEVHGRDYFFVSKEKFLELQKKDFFAEWAKVHENYYGTPKNAIFEALKQGKDLLFDIDVQGALQLKNNLQQGVYVFIFPPSLEELKNRLLNRATDSKEQIQIRLKNAQKEIEQASVFDYWIVNDDLKKAYLELKSIIIAEKLKPQYHPFLIKRILQK
ncbi:MAG: guanylate kinase [Desulfonauticus sp.]|nr:guanylate kinase [Desulfonauticus sp.]